MRFLSTRAGVGRPCDPIKGDPTMPDLRLFDIVTPFVVTFDLLQKRDNLIDETEALATAVMVALGTEPPRQSTTISCRRATHQRHRPPRMVGRHKRRRRYGTAGRSARGYGCSSGTRSPTTPRARARRSRASTPISARRCSRSSEQGMRSRIDVDVTRPELQTIVATRDAIAGRCRRSNCNIKPLWNEIGQ